MKVTADFEQSPTKENLIHLNKDQTVGQWRDSGSGLGGGRIPYDVNTALAPAALRSIASLSSNGFFLSHPDWNTVASKRATFWKTTRCLSSKSISRRRKPRASSRNMSTRRAFQARSIHPP